MASPQVTSPPTIRSRTTFISASIGKKVLMAISGLVAFGYIIGHMLGNLQIFLGQDQINAYAETLHSLGAGLWVVRVVLLFFIVLHIQMGIKLKKENLRAKPVNYKFNETVQASSSARTMIWSGTTILAFVIYHILHFTVRNTDPQFLQMPLDIAGRYDVYSMIILGFQNYAVSGFYVVAVGLLSFHLSHGLYSMFQTLGLANNSYSKLLHGFAHSVALIIFLGFSAVPVAVVSGVLKLPKTSSSNIQIQLDNQPQQTSLQAGGQE